MNDASNSPREWMTQIVGTDVYCLKKKRLVDKNICIYVCRKCERETCLMPSNYV